MRKVNHFLEVQGLEISLKTINNHDYISLTDMTANQEEGSKLIEKWLSNKNTIEYLGIWEDLNNPRFNSPEFREIYNQAGVNRFYLSAKQWTAKTNAIGIQSTAGRYGGTYAHKDIAFHFAMWISPAFQLYIVKEYQTLKEVQSNQYNLEWNVRRILAKTNYQIHTQAVKDFVIPKFSQIKEAVLYADEADLLNLALFGCTAKQWREANPKNAKNGENIRDMASINELIILSNLENLNAQLLQNNISKEDRLRFLLNVATQQRAVLDKDHLKSIKKLNEKTFLKS